MKQDLLLASVVWSVLIRLSVYIFSFFLSFVWQQPPHYVDIICGVFLIGYKVSASNVDVTYCLTWACACVVS